MARFDYSSYEAKKRENSTQAEKGSKEKKFDFFNLNQDGDEAIVRFPYKNVDELDTVSVHMLYKKQGDKYPSLKINCLREPFEPLNKCPLCESGEKPTTKFFCKFIEYKKDDTGKMTARAKVWERSMSIATKLSSFIEEYGDLSNMVFKIKRYGKSGDKDTHYEIIPARQDIYTDAVCVKDFSAFEGLDLVKLLVRNKTESEMNYYLENGEFPVRETKESSTPDNVSESKSEVHTSTPSDLVRTPVADTSKPAANTDPTASGSRPRRYEYK